MKRNEQVKYIERLLRNYSVWKDSEKESIQKKAGALTSALNYMKKTEPYFEIIELFYFEGRTLEDIAETINVDRATVWRHKKRLISRLIELVFDDEITNEWIEDRKQA